MNFAHPRVLWMSLILLPLLALFLWATWRKRQSLVRQFVQNKTLAQLTLGISTARQKIRRVLLLLAVTLLLATMAGPQWGFTWEEATQRGRDIIVAIDTSRSMLAEDIQPNRLARGKLAALDLLKLGKFDRFGLIAFSGTAFLQCPLTFDDEAFRQSIQILAPGIIPQGGTALNEAIQTAMGAFAEDTDQNHRILILFTDGEDHEQGVMETVTRAVDGGMKIFTVGVGTPAGELLRIRDEKGQSGFVKDDSGNVVKSRLNEPLLQEIAEKGGGFYLPLQGASAMELLYAKGLAPLPTSERSSKLLKRFREQYYWPLAVAILLLIFEALIPEQKQGPTDNKKVRSLRTSSSVAMSVLLLIVTSVGVFASTAEAKRLYQSKNYPGALAEYQKELTKSPNDHYLQYNTGAAAFKTENFGQAAELFSKAAGAQDIGLQQKSSFNLGSSLNRIGDAAQNQNEKREQWKAAIKCFDTALRLDPKDARAKQYRDAIQKKLDELPKQDQQDNQDKKEKDQKDQNNENQQQNKDDQQNQDSKSQQQDQKSEEQKQNNSSQEEKDKNGKENEQQQQQPSQQEKQDQQQNAQSQPKSGEKDSNDQQPDSEGQGEMAQLGKMTPTQAKQLLDAQRDEEKALIFIPQERKTDSRNRTFKDW